MKKEDTDSKVKQTGHDLDDPLTDPTGQPLSRSIIDTIQESLIILDQNLNIIAASKSFYKTFGLNYSDVNGKLFYKLGDGQWDIPSLRKLLEEVIPQHKSIENYEVDCDFSMLGKRAMIINAKAIEYNGDLKKILIAIFDITERRKLEAEKENLARQKDILIREMRHRIANSLQIIASILLLKAHEVTSEETRSQLEEVHDRIMSVATVQGHLDPTGLNGDIEVRAYLNELCKGLAKSMIGDKRPLKIKVDAGAGKVNSDEAIGIGLITTELIINAIKHAFNPNKEGEITVSYRSDGPRWELSIKDNGSGMPEDGLNIRKGLGTGIVDSLVKQLNAETKIKSTPEGTTVSVVHG